MRIFEWNRLLTSTSAVVVLLASVFATPPAASAQTSKIPVISLKRFIAMPEWALDITWSAHDAYEDADRSGKVEMTATVRYILNQRDKKDAWGRWDVESVKSYNLVFNGSLVFKNKGQRNEWRSTGRTHDEPWGCFRGWRGHTGLPVNISNGFSDEGHGYWHGDDGWHFDTGDVGSWLEPSYFRRRTPAQHGHNHSWFAGLALGCASLWLEPAAQDKGGDSVRAATDRSPPATCASEKEVTLSNHTRGKRHRCGRLIINRINLTWNSR